MKAKRLMVFVLALVCMQFLAGCSSTTSERNGGFIRETYTGIVEDHILDESGEYLRVDIGNDEVINFLITDSSEIDEDTTISIGDTIEIDSVLWYDTNTYEALKLAMIG